MRAGRLTLWSCGVAVSSAVFASGGVAQDRIEISGEETYCDCRVVLEHVVTLGDEGEGMIRNETRQVGVTSDGVYHVLAWRDFQITRYAPDGQPLPPLFREGSGPMETKRVDAFQIVADTLLVYDSGNGRVVFVGPDQQEVRTLPTTSSSSGIAYDPGRGVLVNRRGFGAQSRGTPLHYVDLGGEHVRSFGRDISTGLDREMTWRRRVASTVGSVWAARPDWYELRKWSFEGEVELHIDRHMAGFEPRLYSEWGGPDEPYKPHIVGIAVDPRGHVRIAMKRGGPHWAERLPPPIEQSTGSVYPVPPGIGLFETVIEIIDPERGRLHARGVVEPEVYGFVDADHVFSYEEDDFGRPTITIWRLRLASRS